MSEFSAPPAALFQRLGGAPALHQLLQHFYADVRQHREIGPIFTGTITDWPAHLEKIASFWTRVTGGPSNYAGSVFHAHMPLNLRPEHFAAWLDLWKRQCRIRLPEKAAEEMVQIAQAMARRLSAAPGISID